MELPQLPAKHTSRDDLISSHRGPTKRSNWIIPAILMAGDRSSLDSEDGLRAILKNDITTIVCLQARQEMASSVDYKKRAQSIKPYLSFVEQPIPDQDVTDDFVVDDLVCQLIERVKCREVLYVHCRGGHGRTGTICSILLGRLYDLKGPEAMARVQLYHDVRQNPVFAAEGYAESADGSSCVMLFPQQRHQVLRLLADTPAPSQAVELKRAQSSAYGPGASKYTEDVMIEWQKYAKEAADALNRGKKHGDYTTLKAASELFWTAARLRPDFVRGYIGLAISLRLIGEVEEARDALLFGLQRCPDDGALLKEMEKLDASKTAASSGSAGYCSEAASVPEPVKENMQPLDWKPKISKPSLLVLVGLPGSGKSTFSMQLASSGQGYERICQDEMEGRDAFETAIGRIAKDSSKKLVLDRTNVKKADRQAFLSLAFNPRGSVCVHFAASTEVCEERVANRTDHPTIKYGGGRGAVRGMRDAFEPPSCSEGFEEVITVNDFREADHLLACWGARVPDVSPVGFFKFPTTPHVLDLTHGKALTESDRLMSPTEAQAFFDGRTTLIVEEKIDGANLGISLTANYEPRFQNRSKYISTEDATQWKALGRWWDEHSWAICQLLEPEVEVLFGEWLWARHSVAYTKLPAYFVAFDIYNKRAGKFVSVRERNRRLEGLDIPVVPHLAERVFSSQSELENFLETTSAFGDGPLEGIYMRIDEPEESGGGVWLQRRGKIVRADFIQTIEEGGHWIHREVERNTLGYD